MSLIDETYFVGDLNIPGTGNQSIGERLDVFIQKHETELLEDLFGYEMYKAFTDNPTAQKWIDLRDGAEYTYQGRTLRWRGLLIKDNPDAPRSLIANYVYFHWMRDNVTSTTTSGEKKSQAENSSNASANVKMARAWNEMSDQIAKMYYFLYASTNDYSQLYLEGSGYYFTPYYWWPSYTHFGKYGKINLLGI